MMCPRSIFLVADGCRTGGSRPDRFSTISGPTGRVDLFPPFLRPTRTTRCDEPELGTEMLGLHYLCRYPHFLSTLAT
jgi:hypothetical protein